MNEVITNRNGEHLKHHADMRVEPIAEQVQLPNRELFPNARRDEPRGRETCGTFTADQILHLLSLATQFGIAARLDGDRPARELNAECLRTLTRMSNEVRK